MGIYFNVRNTEYLDKNNFHQLHISAYITKRFKGSVGKIIKPSKKTKQNLGENTSISLNWLKYFQSIKSTEEITKVNASILDYLKY